MGPQRERGTLAGPQLFPHCVPLSVLLVVLGAPSEAFAQWGERGFSIVQAAPAPAAPGAAPTPPPSTTPTQPPPVAPVTPPPPTVPSTRPPAFPRLTELVTGVGVRPLATFEWHPSIGLTEEYTDNFNLSSSNEQENFRTSLTLGVALLINGVRTKGEISTSFSGSYDSSTGDVTPDRAISLSGRVTYDVSPLLKLTVTDVLTRSDEPSQADQLSLRRERREFISNAFSVSADYLIGTIATSASYGLTTFFEEDGADTISHTIGVSASKSFLQTNSATLGYEFLRSDTSEGGSEVTGHEITASVARQLNPFTTAGLSSSYAVRTVTPGNDYYIGSISLFGGYSVPGIWSVTASVGYSRLFTEGEEDEGAPTASATLTYHFARAIATLGVDAGFSETFGSGENFGVVETFGVRGSLSYPITPLVMGTASGFYRRNDFTGVAGGQSGVTEDTYGGLFSVSMRLLRWLNLELDYAHTRAESDGVDGGYTENRVSLSLTGTF